MIGGRLGPYEITAKLGEGGMGEVYRAKDTRLDRAVAIKVLPSAFTQDAERLARFEREAKLLAQLHHPNIASIFGLEESGGTRALVMELVEGPTLAERLAGGPLPLDECVSIAMDIAQALEEAHEKGIVHRDLKPQNIKAPAGGKVKVLDFGLAKAMDESLPTASSSAAADLARSPTLMNSPTLTAAFAPGTQLGVILGTAAYMSPEQAKGRPVDKRSDIWAFGVVLYEMLVGRKLFDAETLPETLGAIFRQAIDLGALPADTPSRLRRLLERCLERDPNRRLRDIGEARIALEAIAVGEVDAPPVSAAPPTGRRGVSLPVFAVALAAAAVLAALLAARWATPSSASVERAPEATEFSLPVEGLVAMQLSPDGRRLAWISRGSATLADAPWTESGEGDIQRQLWVRDLGDRVPREVASNAELRYGFWSPDSAQVAVQIGERLWRIPIAGGERAPICDLPAIEGVSGRGVLAGAWAPDGTLFFAAWRGGLFRVPARGGDPELAIPIDPKVDVDFHAVLLLPDGKSLVLLTHLQNVAGGSATTNMRVDLFRDGRREPLPGGEELTSVAPIGYAGGILALQTVETTESLIWGVPFDAERGVVTGKKFVLVPSVDAGSVGANGTVAFVPRRERPSVVVRVDAAGKELARFGDPHPHLDRQALSPDGSRLAVVLNTEELWVRDLARGTLTRVATEPKEFIEDPQWAPDGRTLYYTVGNSSIFRRVRADPGATPETVLDDAYRSFLARDGSGILLRKGGYKLSPDQGFFWAPLDARGRPGERKKILGGLDSLGRLSPGGRLLAYGEGLSGRREAFLASFPAIDQTIQLSANGGGTPQWSADGKAVYFLSGGALIEVQVGVDSAGRLTASPETKLFTLDEVGLRPDGWSTAPDGDGFLLLKSLATDDRSEIVVVKNGIERAKSATR